MLGETAPSASVLELLALPHVPRLSDAQRRGTACVWCAVALAPDTARNLGARPAPDGGQMFPRGCPNCIRGEALRVYGMHERTCEQCVDDPTVCDTRRALRRLALEGRR